MITTLNIKPGQKWRTVTGRTVRIDSACTMHGYDFTGSYYGTRTGVTYFTAAGISIGRDDLLEMIQEAPEPVVTAPEPVNAYLDAAIDDELTIAALLHWQGFAKPQTPTPFGWIQGTHNSRNGHVRNGSVPMPMWRRSWAGAGELISPCGLSIAMSPAGVSVCAESGPSVRALFHDHPSKDDAIRFAMCKAAIAYLQSNEARKP